MTQRNTKRLKTLVLATGLYTDFDEFSNMPCAVVKNYLKDSRYVYTAKIHFNARLPTTDTQNTVLFSALYNHNDKNSTEV